MEKSASELFGEYDEMYKKHKENIKRTHLVEQEILDIQRQILELQLEKKKHQQSLDHAKHTEKQTQIDLNLLKSAGWAARNSGL